MRVFIAEKPSVARAIADVLGVKQRHKGYIECNDGTLITNCFGHMYELWEPQKYLPEELREKSWAEQPLPIIPEKWQKSKKHGVADQLKVIKELLSKADEVVNAGDPDREGQLLVDEVLDANRYKGKVLRYWQSAMDKVSVKRALDNIVPNEQYSKWGKAAEARSRADWLIGMNMSRQITVQQKAGTISVGRVQTPVLRLIVNRDLAIENFKETFFYNVLSTVICPDGSFVAQLDLPKEILDEDNHLLDEKVAQQLLKEIDGKPGKIKAINVQNKKEAPKNLFTLTTLSAECSRRFKFSAKKTLDVAQKLYEEYKLTSYPRSSCEYLPSSQQPDVAPILAHLKIAFPQYKEHIETCDPNRESKVWNDRKVNESAHTGIVPTLQGITPDKLAEIDPDCAKVYELIAKRYIATFMADHTYTTKSVVVSVQDSAYTLGAKFVIPNQIGWKALYRNDQNVEEDNEKGIKEPMPASVVEGLDVKIDGSKVEQGKCKPPAYFTEGTLMMAMKNIAKEVDDPEEKKLLKDDDGLGTEATRAAIIETLKDRKFIKNEKGKLKSTEFGRAVLTVIPMSLQSASLTAQNEKKLSQVQKGELDLNSFVNHQVEELKKFMSEAENNPTRISNPDLKRIPCPKCGSTKFFRNLTKDKKRVYYHCADCDAYFDEENGKPVERAPVITETCPECGGKVYRNERKDKTGSYWKCKECGTYFKDQDGKLGPKEEPKKARPQAKCPLCGGTVELFERKDGSGSFWKCKDCGKFCNDQNGVPVVQEKKETAKCPKCGGTCYRNEKKDKSGFYWRCSKCKEFFNDKEGKMEAKKDAPKAKK